MCVLYARMTSPPLPLITSWELRKKKIVRLNGSEELPYVWNMSDCASDVLAGDNKLLSCEFGLTRIMVARKLGETRLFTRIAYFEILRMILTLILTVILTVTQNPGEILIVALTVILISYYVISQILVRLRQL